MPRGRWKEHVGPNEDFDIGYRERPPVEYLARARPDLTACKLLSEAERLSIEREIDAEVEEAIDFAERSPAPAIEELYTNVYAA